MRPSLTSWKFSAVSRVSGVVKIHCCNADDMVLVHVGLIKKKKHVVFPESLAFGFAIKIE